MKETGVIDIEGVNVTDSALLEFARESLDSSGNLPEPVWVLERDNYEAIWYPDSGTLDAANHAHTIRLSDRSPVQATIEFWKRYRSINHVERGRIVQYLDSETSTNKEEFFQVLSLIDVPPDEEWISVYKQLPDLTEGVKDKLRKDEIGPRLIRYLERMSEEISTILLDQIGKGTVDFTVQLARSLCDVLKRLGSDKQDELRKFLRHGRRSGDNTESPRERANELIDEARKLAYPRTERRKKKFHDELESLDLNGRLNVEPPKNFEGNHLNFSFRCERDESLQKFLEEIKRCQPLFEHV